MDRMTRLVAFRFAMAYHELTQEAMVIKALQNWPIAEAEYVTKVHANSVDILLAVPADQIGAIEPLVVCYGRKSIKADFSGFVMDEDEENATAGTHTCVIEWKHIGDDHTPSAPQDKLVLDEQQYLELKAFVQKARAPQCRQVIKDRRGESPGNEGAKYQERIPITYKPVSKLAK